MMDRKGSRPAWGSAPGAKMSRQASNRMASGSHASSRSLRSVSSTNSPPPPRIAQESPKCLMQSFAEEDSTSCCDQDADGEQMEEWRTAQELKIPDGVVCTLEAMVKAMKENPDKFHTNLSPQMAKLLNGLLRTDSLDEEVVVPLTMICAAIANAKQQPSFGVRLARFVFSSIKIFSLIFQALFLFSLLMPFFLKQSNMQALPPV